MQVIALSVAQFLGYVGTSSSLTDEERPETHGVLCDRAFPVSDHGNDAGQYCALASGVTAEAVRLRCGCPILYLLCFSRKIVMGVSSAVQFLFYVFNENSVLECGEYI